MPTYYWIGFDNDFRNFSFLYSLLKQMNSVLTRWLYLPYFQMWPLCPERQGGSKYCCIYYPIKAENNKQKVLSIAKYHNIFTITPSLIFERKKSKYNQEFGRILCFKIQNGFYVFFYQKTMCTYRSRAGTGAVTLKALKILSPIYEISIGPI